MNAGDTDVVNGVHLVAHDLGGDLSFFGNRNIAGAGAHYGDDAFSTNGLVAPESNGARQ